jgi:opacity protein-like surface antigen
MRRDFLFGIGLLASVAAGAGSAVAADIPVRPPPVAAPVTCCAVPDWVGFYVGIHGGGGWGHTSIEPQEFFSVNGVPSTFFVPPDVSPKGGVFGFQFGHNWQWGPVVGGLEIDFSGADIKETNTFVFPAFFPFDTFTHEAKIEELASARGRLGYLILPNWLLYGTAGIGWGHFRVNTTDTFRVDGITAVDSVTTFANEFGWVAGVGLEWKFWPGSNSWLLRGEWLHYDFGRTSHFDQAAAGFGGFLSNFNERVTVDVARAALSYKF